MQNLLKLFGLITLTEQEFTDIISNRDDRTLTVMRKVRENEEVFRLLRSLSFDCASKYQDKKFMDAVVTIGKKYLKINL